MFQLSNNCIHFTCQQGNAQNPSSQASTVCELRTSRCRSVQTGSEIKLSTPTGSQKKQGNSRKAPTSALLTMFHKCQKFVNHWCKINILLDFSLIFVLFSKYYLVINPFSLSEFVHCHQFCVLLYISICLILFLLFSTLFSLEFVCVCARVCECLYDIILFIMVVLQILVQKKRSYLFFDD